MRISCSTLVCRLKDFPSIDKAVCHIHGMGFDAIDLAAFEKWQNVNPSWLVKNYKSWATELESVLAETAMCVGSINACPSVAITEPDPASFDLYQKEFVTLLKLAERLNCPNLTVQPGHVGKWEEFDAVFERAQHRFQTLAELQQEYRVTVSIEGHYDSLLENPEAALRMAQELWPAVGLTYDPSHLSMQGIALQDTEALLAYTHHVHVRNASLGNMQETMEKGLVDFSWLISALRKARYGGSIAVEYFNGFDSDFRETRELQKLLQELLQAYEE